jgi:hypothetical protein
MRHTHEEQDQWEQHHHDGLVHSHDHYHVTHNFNKMVGGFDHLTSEHDHEHNHAEVTHRHFPHKNWELEHEMEAHVHDHDVPTRKGA